MNNKRNDDGEKKTTSEKPVSLSPLKFKEALAGLLKVKPKEEKEDDQKKSKKEKTGDSPDLP